MQDDLLTANNAQASASGKTAPRPVGKVRWGMPVLLFCGAVIAYLDRANLAIANPLIAQEFQLSPGMMGILLSAFLWPYALANLPAGWLVDRFGPKRLFALSVGTWSIVTFLTGFMNRFSFFYGMRVLLGIAESPFFPVGAKVCNRWFPSVERGRAMSILHAGPQVANAVAPPILTALMLTFGWRYMFFILGIASMLLVAVWYYVYQNPEDHKTLTPEEYEYIKAGQEDDSPAEKISWLQLLKHKTTMAMIVGNFGLIYLHWTFWTWLPGYLVQGRGLSIIKTGWVAMIPFLAGVIGVPLGGIISDYLIKKGYDPITARKIPILTGAILTAIAVAPAAYVESTAVSVALLSIGSFTAMLVPGVVWTLATDVAPKNLVASLGAIQNSGGYLGATLAPIVTGFIVQYTGSFHLVFVVGAVLCIISAISYGFFLKGPIRLDETPDPRS